MQIQTHAHKPRSLYGLRLSELTESVALRRFETAQIEDAARLASLIRAFISLASVRYQSLPITITTHFE